MRLVVDASVALKWFFHDRAGEIDSGHALAILSAIRSDHASAFQPPHWLAKVMAVIARKTPDLADGALLTLDALGLPSVDNDAVYARAVKLSIQLDHHLFDTLYHAVALERGAVLVTADRRYFNKASAEGSIVMLEDFCQSK